MLRRVGQKRIAICNDKLHVKPTEERRNKEVTVKSYLLQALDLVIMTMYLVKMQIVPVAQKEKRDFTNGEN